MIAPDDHFYNIMCSVVIGLKLFGESYSGLEYDYRGLCHVYESLQEIEKCLEYHDILETWKVLREGREEESVSTNYFKRNINRDLLDKSWFVKITCTSRNRKEPHDPFSDNFDTKHKHCL